MNLDTATLQDLKANFGKLLSSKIDVEPDPDPTFLHISGFPHYEDVISNWYAFFFTSSQKHKFKTLFIDSLIELINETAKFPALPQFETCKVIRERYVKDKRIDLLIYDEAREEDGTESYRNAIIVENKINANLYNDLNLYYNNINTDEVKIGVVLSLVSHSGMPDTYVNLTHFDFLNRIIRKMGNYLLRADGKYLLLLKDLVQQVQSFTNTGSMKEYIHFYFENAEKINELNQVKAKATDAVLNELNTALQATSFGWGRKYPESVNIRYTADWGVLLILKTDRLFEHSEYTLELWLSGEFAKSWNKERDKAQFLAQTTPPPSFSFNQNKTGQQWSLIGKQEVGFEKSIKGIEGFPALICADLEANWKPFVGQILSIPTP